MSYLSFSCWRIYLCLPKISGNIEIQGLHVCLTHVIHLYPVGEFASDACKILCGASLAFGDLMLAHSV